MSYNKNLFIKKSNFPYTYGDFEKTNEKKLSDPIIAVARDERVQNYIAAVSFAIYILGANAAPVGAIPPEAGEFAAGIAGSANQQIPPVGKAKGSLNLDPKVKSINGPGNIKEPYTFYGSQYNYGTPPGPVTGAPKKLVNYVLPGPPQSPTGQKINTFLALASVGYVCLQGFWGNPIFFWGCAGMVGRFLLEMETKL